jgi:glutaredoxin
MKPSLPRLPLGTLLLLLCAASAQAQVYKWIGPDGKFIYSDTPPPNPAGRVEQRPLTGAGSANGANSGDLPFELAEAIKNHPVTLYTTRNCIPCDEGRKLLGERGVPFAEKTVNSNEDIAQFRKVNSDGQLPLLTVGRQKELGFEASLWNAALSAAGYPETSRLPKNFRSPPAEAAAPSARPAVVEGQAASAAPAPIPGATALPPPVGNAPPGFRF